MTRLNGPSIAVPAIAGGLLLVTSPVTTVRGDDELLRPAGAVQARSLDANPPVALPADYGPVLQPNHPPIDMIPAFPMPRATATVGPRRVGQGSMLVHDIEAGETVEILGPVPSGARGDSGGGYNGADGGEGWEERGTTSGFSEMVHVTNPWDFPFRMNCKLVARFTDTGGATRWIQGSAAMIDAETVITAGHCVYGRQFDGIPIYDWADQIWIYPAWDGVGGFNEPPLIVEHYGFGHATYLAAGSAWVNAGSLDEDCGLIRISRGVGMLTGWFGWTWGEDCEWILARDYYNASYPLESCHNGKDMYYWWGRADACYHNQIELTTDGGCYSSGWGGMSGSGMYWLDGELRRVHAIASNSLPSDYVRYCKLWETFATNMRDSFIPGSRGNAFDLQALDVNVEPGTIENGDPLTESDFLAINPTNRGAGGTWTFRIYLSEDAVISDEDTLLSTQAFDWDFEPMSAVRVYFDPPTISHQTPPITYRVGVILDPATDVDATNNDTQGWDAAELVVFDSCPQPPLHSTALTPSTDWRLLILRTLDPDTCELHRMYLYPGYDYDFSVCAADGVGGVADPGDADLTMYDGAGNELWYLDGHIDCDYDASTIGSAYEAWSPPEPGYYYLKISEFFGDPMNYNMAYKYTSAEHCYEPPSSDLGLSPSSVWQTTSVQSIGAPGGCRVNRMYLSTALDYDFSICAGDGVGGWADPGDGDFGMINALGGVEWTIDGERECDYDASTLGSSYEAWSPRGDGLHYLVVDDRDDETMDFQLAYRITPGPPPPNDDCRDVAPVPLLPGLPIVFSGVNVGATIDSDLELPEVWHAFRTAECLDVTLSYCGTTPVHAYVYDVLKDECPAFGPNFDASDHETDTCHDSNWTISWNALPSGIYWYPVLTRPGSEGPYELKVVGAPCDACPGDATGDGIVDFADVLELLATWGPCEDCPADFDDSGDVDFEDLITLLGAWGPC